MKALIAGAMSVDARTWADLGAGTGNFTRALCELLTAGSVVYAVDRDARALRSVTGHMSETPDVRLHTLVRDITQPLNLPLLDGILMANALHWNTGQQRLLQHCLEQLAPRGRLLVVEYETERAVSWVPVPVTFRRFGELATAAGFAPPRLVATRHSPSNNISMYAAVARRSS